MQVAVEWDLNCRQDTYFFPRPTEYEALVPDALKGILPRETVSAAERVAQSVYDAVTRGVEPLRVDVRRLATLRKQRQWSAQRAADASMNLAPAPQDLLSGSLEELLTSMDRSGVERAVTSNRPGR